MGGDGLTIGAGEADIHQGVGVQKVLEWGEGIETVVVPFQVELLGLHDEEEDQEKKGSLMMGMCLLLVRTWLICFEDFFLAQILEGLFRGSQQHVKRQRMSGRYCLLLGVFL